MKLAMDRASVALPQVLPQSTTLQPPHQMGIRAQPPAQVDQRLPGLRRSVPRLLARPRMRRAGVL